MLIKYYFINVYSLKIKYTKLVFSWFVAKFRDG